MNRYPKFKVWNKINKEFVTDFTITLDGNLLCDNGKTLFVRDNFSLIQTDPIEWFYDGADSNIGTKND